MNKFMKNKVGITLMAIGLLSSAFYENSKTFWHFFIHILEFSDKNIKL